MYFNKYDKPLKNYKRKTNGWIEKKILYILIVSI